MSEFNHGVFNAFWNGSPNHLPLKGLKSHGPDHGEWNLSRSLGLIRDLMNAHSQAEVNDGLNRLIENENWRPHLVAILVLVRSDPEVQVAYIEPLWDRLRRGSWVSPQILVVLSLIDPGFKNKAETIVENGWNITYAELSGPAHYNARGGRGPTVDQHKVVAACRYLSTGEVNDGPNEDSGGRIAANWEQNLLDLMKNGLW